MRKKLAFLLVLVAAIGNLIYFFREDIQKQLFKPLPTNVEKGLTAQELIDTQKETSKDPQKKIDESDEDIKVIASGLEVPWEIVFIDKDSMLVTERPGRLLKITTGGEIASIQEISGVVHIGEGGLLGMTLHPQFRSNKYLYLYLTTRVGESLINRVERYKFDGTSLSDRTVILDNIPGARYHDGGRIEFGPDSFLYVTTGDAEDEKKAQDIRLLNGKILRLKDDGTIPEGNPFGNAVYSYGHRNPQGLAWDDQGRFWSTEHGPSGINTGYDELNLIGKGLNYGWPKIKGDQWQPDLEVPIIQSGSSDTWAPSDAVYYGGSVFFTGLRGESLYEVNVKNLRDVSIKAHFREEFGRLRALKIGPDGYFYVTTSNQDGRGDPTLDDDKIIRVNPSVFRR